MINVMKSEYNLISCKFVQDEFECSLISASMIENLIYT